MDDPQAPAIGTQGIVEGVDDAGDLMVRWDNGSGIKIILDVDRFHVISSELEIEESLRWWESNHRADNICPRCGGGLERIDSPFGYRPAISRLIDIPVCYECGAQESLIAAEEHLAGQNIGLNIENANEKTLIGLSRKTLKDWWIVRGWTGNECGQEAGDAAESVKTEAGEVEVAE